MSEAPEHDCLHCRLLAAFNEWATTDTLISDVREGVGAFLADIAATAPTVPDGEKFIVEAATFALGSLPECFEDRKTFDAGGGSTRH